MPAWPWNAVLIIGGLLALDAFIIFAGWQLDRLPRPPQPPRQPTDESEWLAEHGIQWDDENA